MPVAQEILHFEFDDTSVLSQSLTHSPFHVDVLEFKTEVPFQFKFQIKEDQLFLLFMLKGSMKFSTDDGKYITEAKDNYYYLSHNGPGMFKSKMLQGEHLAFVVAIELEWAKQVFEELPNLNSIIQQIFESAHPYNIMPHCKIDKRIQQWLDEIRLLTRTSIGVLDGIFRLYLSLILEHYNNLLTSAGRMLAYNVKIYLDKHFTDQEISYSTLARLFSVTERTLRNQFKAELHITVHDYYTRLRMELAWQLIEIHKLTAREVYFQVGYKDERSFRYAYRKFFDK